MTPRLSELRRRASVLREVALRNVERAKRQDNAAECLAIASRAATQAEDLDARADAITTQDVLLRQAFGEHIPFFTSTGAA